MERQGASGRFFKQENIRVRSEFQKDNAGGIMTNRGKEGNSTNRLVREVVRGECDMLE